MSHWHLDQWSYLERRVVTDPRGREWTVALMDLEGQAGDADGPAAVLEAAQAAGRYFTLVYAPSGTIQRERAHASLAEAKAAWEDLVAGVLRGEVDPAQPTFRQDLED